MTFDEKLQAAKKLLASKGIWRRNYAPTLVVLLWRLGLEIPPPHFASFWSTFSFSAGVFAVGWGLLMWLLFWSRHGTPVSMAVSVSAFAGLMFGLCMASYYRFSARKHAIPRWDRFAPTTHTTDR